LFESDALFKQYSGFSYPEKCEFRLFKGIFIPWLPDSSLLFILKIDVAGRE
jgi:hypothetical protein